MEPWTHPAAARSQGISAGLFTMGGVGTPSQWSNAKGLGMSRPFFSESVEELERLAKDHEAEPLVLREILDELKHRRSRRAKQFRRELRARLDGGVKRRKGTGTEGDGQLDLLPE